MSERARVVVVTGSSSGIGRAISERLLAAGHTVIGLARQHAKFEPTLGDYQAVTVDLGDLAAAAVALDRVARDNPEISAVVSNAGAGDFAEIEQFSAARIRASIDLNLTSHLLVARAFLPGLKRDGGDVVFIGSVSGRRGARRGALYNAAKFGLRGLAQALRDETARAAVRVTLISAGAVRTPFFDGVDFEPAPGPENALEPGDVAEVVETVLASRSFVSFDEIVLTPRHPSWRAKPSRDPQPD